MQLSILLNRHSKKKINKISPITSTERESAISLLNVKKEHIFRYNLAREIIIKNYNEKKTFGLDIFCANGYGTYFIGKFVQNSKITGIDGSKDAIKIAKRYYKKENVEYKTEIFPFKLKENFYDYVICFESLEHIYNPENLLKEIYKSLQENGIFFVSTPNEDLIPLDKNPNQFHIQQFKFHEIKNMLLKTGFKIQETYGQNIFELYNGEIVKLLPNKERNVVKNLIGQHVIFYCRK